MICCLGLARGTFVCILISLISYSYTSDNGWMCGEIKNTVGCALGCLKPAKFCEGRAVVRCSHVSRVGQRAWVNGLNSAISLWIYSVDIFFFFYLFFFTYAQFLICIVVIFVGLKHIFIFNAHNAHTFVTTLYIMHILPLRIFCSWEFEQLQLSWFVLGDQ